LTCFIGIIAYADCRGLLVEIAARHCFRENQRDNADRRLRLAAPPVFTAITLANGHDSNLQVVGLGDDGRAYLVAWQCAPTGVWRIQNTNTLSIAKGSYSQLVLTVGADNNLQLMGLASDAAGGRVPQELYLLAWQDHQNGAWNLPLQKEYGYALRPGWKFKFFQAALGADGNLEVVGLGLNDLLYRAAHQEKKTGGWGQPPADEPPLSKKFPCEHQSLVMARNGRDTLLVFGISGNAALIFAYQFKNDSWTSNANHELRPGVLFGQPALGLGSDKTLQLLGQKLGAEPGEDEIWLVGYDKDGTWHEPYPGNTGNLRPGGKLQGVVVGKARDGQLRAFGVDNYGQVYMVAQHSKDGWLPPSGNDAGIIGGESPGGYWPIVAAHRSGNSLLLAGLRSGTDKGIPAIVARRDQFRNWLPGQSLSLRDRHGSWNPRVTDVKSAFLKVKKDGVIDKYFRNEVSFISDRHFQGMARYRHYDILTHDGTFQGYIVRADRSARKLVKKTIDVPNDNERNHPDGCQVIGDYMVMGLENYSYFAGKGKDGVVRFYWLGCMTDETPPELLPFQIPRGAERRRRRRDHGYRRRRRAALPRRGL
jgi:hypothetical protein